MLNSQIETVTLPREVVLDVINTLESEGYPFTAKTLRAALDATAKPVDCRGCMNSFANSRSALTCGISPHCTDFDKFTALSPVVLTKVTK